MLKSLREALAQYALGDDDDGNGTGDVVAPIEEPVAALAEAIEAAENHLRRYGFDVARLRGAIGFDRIEALRDARGALYTSDEAKRRFEITARLVFTRFKALLMEPSAFAYAERHDNIEAIYKKLLDRRETADVTELLKELHRIVNETIRASERGGDHAEGLKVDLSQIDFDKLRDEFAKNVRRKHAALQGVPDVVEAKLALMLARNPLLMDYYRKYQEIIADYNRSRLGDNSPGCVATVDALEVHRSSDSCAATRATAGRIREQQLVTLSGRRTRESSDSSARC